MRYRHKLRIFESKRNIPTEDALSNMSAYFHFGHVSPQAAMLHVQAHGKDHPKETACYLEEVSDSHLPSLSCLDWRCRGGEKRERRRNEKAELREKGAKRE